MVLIFYVNTNYGNQMALQKFYLSIEQYHYIDNFYPNSSDSQKTHFYILKEIYLCFYFSKINIYDRIWKKEG